MTSRETHNQTFRVKCPNLECQRLLAVPGHARGHMVRCLHCMTHLKVPVAAKGTNRWQAARA